MPILKNGFVGKAADKYFSKVNKTLEKGKTGIKEGDKLSAFLNKEPAYKPMGSAYEGYEKKLYDASENLLSSINGYVVNVDDDKYEYISKKATGINEDASNKISYIINEIESMAQQEFLLPETSKKVLLLLKDLKEELPNISKLSNEVTENIKRFVLTIGEIDR